jgi:hypothetical protein
MHGRAAIPIVPDNARAAPRGQRTHLVDTTAIGGAAHPTFFPIPRAIRRFYRFHHTSNCGSCGN